MNELNIPWAAFLMHSCEWTEITCLIFICSILPGIYRWNKKSPFGPSGTQSSPADRLHFWLDMVQKFKTKEHEHKINRKQQ